MDIDELKKKIKFEERTGILDVALDGDVVRGEVSEKGYLRHLARHFSRVEVSLLSSEEGIVCAAVADMRRNPDSASELVSQALGGSLLKIWRKAGGFCLCQTPDEYLGWMASEDIRTAPSTEIREWRKKGKMVGSARVRILASPGENATIIAEAYASSFLLPLSGDSSWMRVRLPDGREGYLRATEIKKVGSGPDDVMRVASSFMDTPYLWGGKSVRGIDCSGLVQTSFGVCGHRLPRDADMQQRATREVKRPRKADLFFFSENKKSITHVGICLGGTRFIHASGKRSGVCVNDLSGGEEYERFLSSIFVDCRRVPIRLKD